MLAGEGGRWRPLKSRMIGRGGRLTCGGWPPGRKGRLPVRVSLCGKTNRAPGWLWGDLAISASLPARQPALSTSNKCAVSSVLCDTSYTFDRVQAKRILIHSRMPQGEHKPGECAGRGWGHMLEGLQSMQGTQGIRLCSLCGHRPCNSRLKLCLCLKSCSLTAAASACNTAPRQVASYNAHEHWASCPHDSTKTSRCAAT